MSVAVKAVAGHRQVKWAWCGTCTRGNSNKYYIGVVVDNGDGTFDGICAGAAIGSPPRVYPQAERTDYETALSKVQKQCNTKKKEYEDSPDFLTGLEQASVGQIRTAAPTPTEGPVDAFRVIWPQLAPNDTPAAKLQEIMEDDNDWVAEEKCDGMRLVGQMLEGGTRYTSRGASVNDPTRPIEKTDALPHLNVQWPEVLWGTAIDGELIALGKISSDVSGALHAQDGRDKSDLIMVLYDLPYFQGRNLTDSGEKMDFYSRRQLLVFVFDLMKDHWMKTYGTLENFPFRLTRQVETNKQAFLDSILAKGGEGIMLKRLGLEDGKADKALYVQGKRPTDTIYKVKKHLDGVDVFIVGFTAGKGKYASQIGAVRFGQYVERDFAIKEGLTKALAVQPKLAPVHAACDRLYVPIELGQVSGMTDALRAQMTANPDQFVGRVMTITAMERLKGGTFRHPQFGGVREEGDKSATECIWEGHLCER